MEVSADGRRADLGAERLKTLPRWFTQTISSAPLGRPEAVGARLNQMLKATL